MSTDEATGNGWIIHCDNCDASPNVTAITRGACIEAWNTRAAAQPSAEGRWWRCPHCQEEFDDVMSSIQALGCCPTEGCLGLPSEFESIPRPDKRASAVTPREEEEYDWVRVYDLAKQLIRISETRPVLPPTSAAVVSPEARWWISCQCASDNKQTRAAAEEILAALEAGKCQMTEALREGFIERIRIICKFCGEEEHNCLCTPAERTLQPDGGKG